MNRERRQQLTRFLDPYLWLTVLLSLPATAPLWHPGYQWGAHDARHAVYFLFQFDKAIRDGIWYPRWSPDFAFGYGYPFFNVYSPLSSYIGELFLWLGFDYVGAVKMTFGLSVILSGVTMYYVARKLLQHPAAGLLAGLIFVYMPYHLYDLYVRAALAESVAFIFVPLVLWAFYRANTQPTLRGVLWGGIAYALLMFTHNASAILLTFVLAIYTVVMILWHTPHPLRPLNRWLLNAIKRGLPPLTVLLSGIGLSAIFLLPAVLETQYIRVDQWVGGRYAFGSDFVEFFQLFSPRWGFGASIAGPNDDTGFQIGLAAVTLFFIALWQVPRIQNRGLRLTLWVFQGMALLITFLTLPLSAWVWQLIPLSSFAQFPWRLLVVLTPLLALLGGTVLLNPNKSATKSNPGAKLSPALPLILLVMLASFPYLTADMRDPKPTEGPVDLAGLFRFQQASDEMTGSTAWVEEIPTWSPLADLVLAGQPITSRVVETEIWNADRSEPLLGVNSWGEVDSVHETVWVYAADDNQRVTFYIPYYPGWTATLYEDSAPDRPDLYPYGRIGKKITELPIDTTSPQGWMTIPVPAGQYFLELRFNSTPIRVIATWISALTLLIVIGLLIFNPTGKRRGRNE